MEAIVLAGGLGRRLQTAVPELPKPMAPINGRPFLEHLLDYWLGQGIRRFIISVGYKREAIQSHFGTAYRGAGVAYAIEETPLGTGGGVLLAMSHLVSDGPFAVLNGDTFFEVDLAKLAQFHAQMDSELTLALRAVEDNSRYTSLELDGKGGVVAFHGRGTGNRPCLINGGVYLVERQAFAESVEGSLAPISLEDDLFPRMLAGGKRLHGYRCNDRFIDIGVPEDYRRAASLLGTA